LHGREYFSRSIWHTSSQSVLDRLLIVVIRLLQVAPESEYPTESWHLEKQINLMWHCHKLGECWTTQYCVVRRFEVSYFEFDELSVVVLPHAEGDWKNYRTKWVRHVTWDDAVKGGLARNHMSLP
jgi:hypothetical protein